MRYLIVVTMGDYEDYDLIIVGSCFTKRKAKMIVDRLEKEDEYNHYEYDYEKNTRYKYTGEYKSEKQERKESVNQFLVHVPLDTGNLRFNSIEWDRKVGEITLPTIPAPYMEHLKEKDKSLDSIELLKGIKLLK
jgi:hypothetical protein